MVRKNIQRVYYSIAIISIICLILSIIIGLEKSSLESNSNQAFCLAIGGVQGCKTVQTSQYSATLGISNPVYGIIGFSILAALSLIILMRDNKLIRYVIIAGGFVAGLAAIWFLYVQTFILQTYCSLCLMVDTLSLVLLCFSIYLLMKSRTLDD